MSDLTDDTKLNCAGEFMSACENSHQLGQAIEILSSLLDDGLASLEYVENISDALAYSIQQAKEHYKDIEDRTALQGDVLNQILKSNQEDVLNQILEFSHAYLAKAYEKKVGRA